MIRKLTILLLCYLHKIKYEDKAIIIRNAAINATETQIQLNCGLFISDLKSNTNNDI